MAGIILVLLVFAALFYALRHLRAMDRPEIDYSVDRDEPARPEWPTAPFGRRRERSAPVRIPPDFSLNFESRHCEICTQSPQKRFLNDASASVLEFCLHHAKKHATNLADRGYKLVFDADAELKKWRNGEQL